MSIISLEATIRWQAQRIEELENLTRELREQVKTAEAAGTPDLAGEIALHFGMDAQAARILARLYNTRGVVTKESLVEAAETYSADPHRLMLVRISNIRGALLARGGVRKSVEIVERIGYALTPHARAVIDAKLGRDQQRGRAR